MIKHPKFMLVAVALAAVSACGKRPAERAPQAGDAFPALPLRLDEWCDRNDISEDTRRTVDALLRSLAAQTCGEFAARYNSLRPKKIVLAFENLTDPAPIVALTDLKELSVRGNKFTSLTWTKDLAGLTSLDAAQNPLGDTDPTLDLAQMAPALTALNLDTTGIKRVIATSGSAVTSLSLAANEIVDAGFLSDWPQLVTLNIEQNPVADLSFLTALTDLTSLRVSADLAADLSGLQQLSRLRELYLRSYPQDLTAEDTWIPPKLEVLEVSVGTSAGDDTRPQFATDLLASLPRLKRLNLSGRTLTGSAIQHEHLQDLTIEGGRIAGEAVLSGMRQLTLLNLKHAGLVLLPDLSQLSNLTTIVADGNSIGLIDGGKLPASLRTLSVEANQVAGVRSGDKVAALTHLNLKDNGISELAAFDWPPNLRSLDLAENSISRLQPLTTLTGLNSLMLSRNLITNPAPLATMLTLEWLDLSHNKLDTIAPLSALTRLGTLDIRSTGLPASVQCPVTNKSVCLF